MTLPSLRRLHRTISIPIGVLIIVWIITGIVPLLPAPAPPPAAPQQLDLTKGLVLPAEAVRALEGSDKGPKVRWIRLQPLGDVTVYEIAMEGRPPQLVDASTGRRITVDAAFAERIAAVRAPAGAKVVRTELVSRRREAMSYRWGSLPAYRVVFDDPASTSVYVSLEGAVQSSTRWSRAVSVIASFHTFDPLDFVVREPAVRKTILVVGGVVALILAGTGYAIVLWRRRGG